MDSLSEKAKYPSRYNTVPWATGDKIIEQGETGKCDKQGWL